MFMHNQCQREIPPAVTSGFREAGGCRCWRQGQLTGLKAYGQVPGSDAALQEPSESCSLYFFSLFFRSKLSCSTRKERGCAGAELF